VANIADHADGDPDSPALIVVDGATVTYGELFERSEHVAALLHRAGLRRGDGVALVLPNRPEFFEITWGCQLSGLYYSAVNTHFTHDEVAYVIADSEARAVFIDASMAELGERILAVNDGVDVHISVGAGLPGCLLGGRLPGSRGLLRGRLLAQRAEVDGAAREDRRRGTWVAHGCLVSHAAQRPRRAGGQPVSDGCADVVAQKRAGSR